ncbi:unnamed protein product [Acanthocheilonema viteae]|uniref:Uncharacterized protein n=1 Tax=Acanthocheilonema viteae TaxID=6277 RepID=A0A498SEX9_ACAVI|nr:unnamed protein product [Acanthocheilonema viteae]
MERILRQLEAMDENIEDSSIETTMDLRKDLSITKQKRKIGLKNRWDNEYPNYSTLKQQIDCLKRMLALTVFGQEMQQAIVTEGNVYVSTAKANIIRLCAIRDMIAHSKLKNLWRKSNTWDEAISKEDKETQRFVIHHFGKNATLRLT